MNVMNRNRWILVVAGVAALVVFGLFAYDKLQQNQLGNGVAVGGVDISGLSREQADAKLTKEIEQVVQQPIVVVHRGERRTLKTKKSQVGVDVPGMVDQALAESNQGFFAARAVRRISGSDLAVSIPVEISYSRPAVRRFVRSVHKSFDRSPKDAKVSYSAKGLGEIDARPGRSVRSRELRRKIVQRLENPTEPRLIHAPMKTTDAKVTTRTDLARKYPTIIIVDRSGFKLRLYKKLRLAKTYPIAVGQSGLETPAGLYAIQDRTINPSWTVPNSAWAGDLAGKVIPPGPENPIVARWLGIANGVGIHGTNDIGSIGSAASHGCIRMKPSDVIALFPSVPVGTPVYIA
jgi:lipoprotein-anchoring transpeptidase ErfK/SrfK